MPEAVFGDGSGQVEQVMLRKRLSSVMERVWFHALTRQFRRFLAVGVATTAFHYGILITLVEVWHANPVWATTAGFVAAALLSYLLNRRYTFDEHPAFVYGLIGYYAVVSVGLLVNAGVMMAFTKWGAHYLVAQVIATGAALIWNFLAGRFLVFRRWSR